MFWKHDVPSFEELTKETPIGHNKDMFGDNRQAGMHSDVYGHHDPFAQHNDSGFSLDNNPSSFNQLQQHQERLQPLQGNSELAPLKKEIELLSAKIDALRASVESMNQRVINIEHSFTKETQRQRQTW